MNTLIKMRLTTAIIMFSISTKAQTLTPMPLFHAVRPTPKALAFKGNLMVRKTSHFKFTASMKPGNKFVQNSEVNLSGLTYEVRAKMYVNKRVSLVVKTKSMTKLSRDVASFGIIFKL